MRIPDLDLKDLALVAAVAESGRLVTAAAHLDLSVSALSHRLTDLEHRLGGPLFVRSAAGMVPTAQGEAFARHARDALAAADRAALAVAPPEAVWRIGSAWIMATTVLPPLVAGLRPGTRVQIRTGRSEQVINWVERRMMDVGLVRASSVRPGVTMRAVGADPVVLAVRSRHPWREAAPGPEAVRAEAFVTISHETGYGRFLAQWARGAGFSPDVAVEVDHLEGALALVAAGVGPSLLPRSLVAPRVQDGSVAIVDAPWLALPERTLALCWPDGREVPPWAQDWAARLAHWLGARQAPPATDPPAVHPL
jgi:DNA-binding transcriptional LysR family regulator